MSSASDNLIARPLTQDPTALELRQSILLLVLCHVLVLAVYIWVFSISTSSRQAEHTNYYDQLASAFRRGQLSLEQKPDPALLALPNPYQPSQRAGINFLMDVSLYRGRYYLYFGPVPALIVMVVKLVYSGSIGDQYLVFLFIYGLFLVLTLLILKLWRRFFSYIPPWMVAASTLLTGLVAPFSWVLGKPNVYNAAIAGGQFFFVAGLYTAFDALDRDNFSRLELALTGLLWSAALGSRITLILPVGFMAVMILVAPLQKTGRPAFLYATLPDIAVLALMLALGAATLAWYNWARFGSVFETGVKYQLAGPDLQASHSDLFSPAYVFQNLYNYSSNAPAPKRAFPFIYSATGKAKSITKHVLLPDFYHAERVTGVLYSAPFLLLGSIPVIATLFFSSNSLRSKDDHHLLLHWMVVCLYGCFFLGLAFFMAFFWAAERYLIDFIPCLLLLSIIGFWQLVRAADKTPLRRLLFISAGVRAHVSLPGGQHPPGLGHRPTSILDSPNKKERPFLVAPLVRLLPPR